MKVLSVLSALLSAAVIWLLAPFTTSAGPEEDEPRIRDLFECAYRSHPDWHSWHGVNTFDITGVDATWTGDDCKRDIIRAKGAWEPIDGIDFNNYTFVAALTPVVEPDAKIIPDRLKVYVWDDDNVIVVRSWGKLAVGLRVPAPRFLLLYSCVTELPWPITPDV